LSGTKTVGSGGNFTTLTGAGGLFETLNNLGLSGNLVVTITTSITTEPGTYALNAWSEVGGSGYTLTIKPAASTTPTISGSLDNNALFRFNGVSRLTIDGSNNGTTSRDLTLANTSATVPYVLHLGSAGTSPISNITLKNCTFSSGANTASSVIVSDASNMNNPGYFSDLYIENNLIQNAYVGIFIYSVTGQGNNFLIKDNDLNIAGANSIRYGGMYLEGVNWGTISGNEIGNFDQATNEDDFGISIGPGSTSIEIFKNRIDNLGYNGTGGYGGHGIELGTDVANANIYIFNNLISNLTGDGWNYTSIIGDNPIGIYLYALTSQGGIYIDYNTIYLTGNTLNKTSAMSAGIVLETGSSAYIRNNIIVNNLGLVSTTGYGSCGIYAETSNTQFTIINYNDYYVNPSGTGAKDIGRISTTACTTLAAWQVATTQDANSINADPLITDALLNLNVPYSPAIGKAAVIAIITDDYSGKTRHLTYPTIGAHEYAPVLTWIGNTPAWTTLSNWSLGFVPDGTYWVIIPTTPAGGNFPIIGSAITATVYGLTVEPGATINVQNGGSINVINP
jgi:hypothetical protein